MPVDKKTLEAYISEVAGDNDAARAALLQTLGDDAIATKFVAGFTRTSDYTQKTQALADEKKKVTQQLTQYETALQAAEGEMDKVMNDLANLKISEAQANTRLSHLKTKYQLDDNDVPTRQEVKKTAVTGEVQGDGIDVKKLQAEFKKELMAELMPEMRGILSLGPIWDDIKENHKDITGKRLTKAEQNELMQEAQASNISLEAAWNKKYDIPKLSRDRDVATAVKAEREKWDTEQKQKRSAEMLDAAGRGRDADFSGSEAPVLRKKFGVGDSDGDGGEKQKQESVTRDRPRGADKMAGLFVEKRAAAQQGSAAA
jgi:hypothetical protein